jgi:hypothetical protein
MVVGILVGSTPLLLKTKTDPFDEASSYLVWVIGLSLSAMVMSIAQSNRVWRWAIAVGLGFPVAVILDIISKPEAYQLPPLTVMFSLLVGLLAAFIGAYLGKFIKRIFHDEEQEKDNA